MKTLNDRDKFYCSYNIGYSSVVNSPEYKELVDNLDPNNGNYNRSVFVVTHPDMKNDRILARELGVLDGINSLTSGAWADKPIATGNIGDLAKWAEGNKGGLVFIRYGFIFNPVRLYDFNSLCFSLQLRPSILYNDYYYWRHAIWRDDLRGTDLYPLSRDNLGTVGLSQHPKGWFIRNNLKSYKQWYQPLKTEEEIKGAINACLDAGSFNGDSSWFATEWMDIALAKDVHPELQADLFNKAEYRCHIALGTEEHPTELIHSHLYDDTYAEVVVPDDVKVFAMLVADRLTYRGSLVAIDIARLTDGSLKCVEVNCGESSGMLYPERYYVNLLRP